MSGIVGQPNQTGSGKIGPATGTVVQTAIYHPASSSTLSSSGSTNVLFGHVGVMPSITAGNSVLITCTFQCNTGSGHANAGGFVYLMRGEWNTTAYSTITSHSDNLAVTQNDAGLTAIPNHSGGNPHIYTHAANHTYWLYTMQFWDRKVVSSGANTQSTATNPRYCLGVVSHPSLSSTTVSVMGGSMYPVTYVMQEIAA